MSTAVHQIRASYAFVERNFNLIKRYWTWELVWLVYSTADCMAVSFIGLGMQKISGSEGLEHLLPGAVPAGRNPGLALPFGHFLLDHRPDCD